jgi:PII-like signaling protein
MPFDPSVADDQPWSRTLCRGDDRVVDKPLYRTSRRLTIIVEDRGDGSTSGIGLVAETILGLARAQGLPGASAFRGTAGFGPDRTDGGPPVMIVAVGDGERIDDFAHAIALALPDGLITLDDVVELVPAVRAAAFGSAETASAPVSGGLHLVANAGSRHG